MKEPRPLDNRQITQWFVGVINRSEDAERVGLYVNDCIHAAAAQKRLEAITPRKVKRRLSQVADSAETVDERLFGDDLVADTVRNATNVGQIRLETFRQDLEDLASAKRTEHRCFIDSEQRKVDESDRAVMAASKVLIEHVFGSSGAAGARREYVRGSGIRRLSQLLKDLTTSARSAVVCLDEAPPPLLGPAVSAGMKMAVTTGGRPIQTSKQVTLQIANQLFAEFGVEITDEPDGLFCEFATLCYDSAMGELGGDLSHAVKAYVQDMRRWKLPTSFGDPQVASSPPWPEPIGP